MVAHGCVIDAHDALSLDLFAGALSELFALPLESMRRNVSAVGPFKGYVGAIPGMTWESVHVEEPCDAGSVRARVLVRSSPILWPLFHR